MNGNKFELCFVLTQGEAKGGGLYQGYYDTLEKALEAAPRCRQELLEDIRNGWRKAGWLTEAEVQTARVLVLG